MSDNHLSSQLLYWISRLDLDCVSCERTLWIAGLLVHFLVLGIFLSLFGLWKPLHVRWPQTSARATIRLALLSVCHQSKPNEDEQQSEQWLFCVNMCVCVCALWTCFWLSLVLRSWFLYPPKYLPPPQHHQMAGFAPSCESQKWQSSPERWEKTGRVQN